MTERKISIVVSEVKNYEDHDDEGNLITCACEHFQYSLSIEELLEQDWFKEELRNLGFFHESDVSDVEAKYSDQYAYKYLKYGNFYFEDNLKALRKEDKIVGIYRRVISHNNKKYNQILERQKAAQKSKKEKYKSE